MEQLKCPLCSIGIDRNEYKEIYHSKIVNTNYKHYICPECSLEFWDPMVIIKEIYEEELHKDYISCHLGLSKNISKNMHPFFENPPFKNGKLLDVGCGEGVFLEKAKELGFDVWGIDFDSKSVATAREKRNLDNVFSMSLSEFVDFAKENALQFDIITFFEVLEHQDNLQTFMRDIKALLKQGGFIVGSVPNRDRFPNKSKIFDKRFAKAFNFVDFPPHHFTRWSTRTVEAYLLKNRFNEILVKRCNFFSLKEASYWWQRMIVGNLITTAKFRIKRLFVQDGQSAHHSLEKINSDNKSNKHLVKLLKSMNEGLKLSEGILFLPFAISTIKPINKEGQNIYFQAKE